MLSWLLCCSSSRVACGRQRLCAALRGYLETYHERKVFRSGGGSVTEQRERVAEFGRELREGPEPSDRSIKEIVEALRPQIQQLVDRQIELARTELVPV